MYTRLKFYICNATIFLPWHSIYPACHAGKHQNFMNLKSILVPNVDVDYRLRFNPMCLFFSWMYGNFNFYSKCWKFQKLLQPISNRYIKLKLTKFRYMYLNFISHLSFVVNLSPVVWLFSSESHRLLLLLFFHLKGKSITWNNENQFIIETKISFIINWNY